MIGAFSQAARLRAAGILGINCRNARYTLVHNPRSLYGLVDDKLATKKLAADAGISVPDLYGVIEIQRQVRGLPDLVSGHEDFVIKPAKGSQGEGILVVTGRAKGLYRLADGQLMDAAALCYHVSNILSGVYSLGGQPDRAMIEYRIRFDPVFEALSYRGVPDIRIIVFLGVPVMAMVRLPTRQSHGKANLHQGAIGAGVDMATGRTLDAVWRGARIGEHPDTGERVHGVAIPGWPDLLRMAARCYELTGLGYLGADIVLDRERGPMILELNARPGLAIQIANGAGLRSRLQRVERERARLTGIDERVAFALSEFSAMGAC